MQKNATKCSSIGTQPGDAIDLVADCFVSDSVLRTFHYYSLEQMEREHMGHRAMLRSPAR